MTDVEIIKTRIQECQDILDWHNKTFSPPYSGTTSIDYLNNRMLNLKNLYIKYLEIENGEKNLQSSDITTGA